MNTSLSQDSEPLLRPNQLPNKISHSDSWAWLSKFTNARIGMGRAGGSQRTQSLLDFRLSHAAARDAVHSVFDYSKIEDSLVKCGIEVEILSSMSNSRESYLKNPELGRRLNPKSVERLKKLSSKWGNKDIVVIISDGLSATAAMSNASDTAIPLIEYLKLSHWSIYPVIIAPFARVKLQDDIGEILGVRHSIILLGERPGLDSPDGLSAYFTFKPKWACQESDRNCVSNIRPRGLPPKIAAKKLYLLLEESRKRGISGTKLKDNISQSLID